MRARIAPSWIIHILVRESPDVEVVVHLLNLLRLLDGRQLRKCLGDIRSEPQELGDLRSVGLPRNFIGGGERVWSIRVRVLAEVRVIGFVRVEASGVGGAILSRFFRRRVERGCFYNGLDTLDGPITADEVSGLCSWSF